MRIHRWQISARRAALLLLASLAAASVSIGSLAQTRPQHGTRVVGPFAAHIAEASRRFGMPVHWISAVLQAESNGDRRAVSPAGAIGLMQIMPDTWAELRVRHKLGNDPFEARDNILAGAAYMSELHAEFGAPGFLAAYNAGPGRYTEYIEQGRPLPPETRAYVAKLAPKLGGSADKPLPKSRSPRADNWSQSPLFAEQSGDNDLAATSPDPDQHASGSALEEDGSRTLFVDRAYPGNSR